MARYEGDEVHIESALDLENEMCKYDCKTAMELCDLLWESYGVILILDYEDEDS